MQDLKQTGNSNSGLQESVRRRGFLADDGRLGSCHLAGPLKCLIARTIAVEESVTDD